MGTLKGVFNFVSSALNQTKEVIATGVELLIDYTTNVTLPETFQTGYTYRDYNTHGNMHYSITGNSEQSFSSRDHSKYPGKSADPINVRVPHLESTPVSGDRHSNSGSSSAVTSVTEVGLERLKQLCVVANMLTMPGIDPFTYQRDSNTCDNHKIKDIEESLKRIEKEAPQVQEKFNAIQEGTTLLKSEFLDRGVNSMSQFLDAIGWFPNSGIGRKSKKQKESDDDFDSRAVEGIDSDGECVIGYDDRSEASTIPVNAITTRRPASSIDSEDAKALRKLCYYTYMGHCVKDFDNLQCFYQHCLDIMRETELLWQDLTDFQHCDFASNDALHRTYLVPTASFEAPTTTCWLSGFIARAICWFYGFKHNEPYQFRDGYWLNRAGQVLIRTYNHPEVNPERLKVIPLGLEIDGFQATNGLTLITLLKWMRQNVNHAGRIMNLDTVLARYRLLTCNVKDLFVYLIEAQYQALGINRDQYFQ